VIAKYICPVTRLEWTPRQPFVIIRTTGWVMSDRAIREVGIGNLQVGEGRMSYGKKGVERLLNRLLLSRMSMALSQVVM